MAVKNSHWFRRRFPLPASRLCNLQQSQLHFNECPRKAGRVLFSWVRDSGKGKGEPYGMAGIVSAIDSVAASRAPLPASRPEKQQLSQLHLTECTWFLPM